MARPILKITNGVDYVDLLNTDSGLLLDTWSPAIASSKGGGIYRESAMSEGRRLLLRRLANPIETYGIKAFGAEQDKTIKSTQDLFRLLQSAVDYWENRWIQTPVWIEARAPKETEIRYAIIQNYTVDNLTNPYAQPFFASPPSTEFNVSIEREQWTSSAPTHPICTPTYSQRGNNTLGETAYVLAGSSDAYVRDQGGDGSNRTLEDTGTLLNLGLESDDDNYEFAFRVSSVDVPKGAHIVRAYLGLTLGASGPNNPRTFMDIYLENSPNTAAFSTLADYDLRRYSEPVRYQVEATTTDAAGTLYNWGAGVLEPLIEQMVNLDGWESGNSMTFKIVMPYLKHEAGIWQFASFENVTYTQPYLVVHYSPNDKDTDQCQTQGQLQSVSGIYGHESETYISQHYAPVGLTDIYAYDYSGTSWSANLLTTTPPYNLFPVAPAIGDMVYFGSEQTNLLGGAFYNLVFDPEDGFATATVVWEYYRGAPASAWQAFSGPPYISDGVNDFQGAFIGEFGGIPPYNRLRKRDVNWYNLKDISGGGNWVEVNLNALLGGSAPSINAYWIRARLTAVTTGNASVLTHPYTVKSPKLSLDDGDVKGDIPAIGRLRIYGASNQLASTEQKIFKVIVGMRTRYPDRDNSPGFSAYIPIQDTFLQDGVLALYPYNAQTTFVDHAGATNGRCAHYNSTGAGTSGVQFELDTDVFRGRYRIFARVAQENASALVSYCYLQIRDGELVTVSRQVDLTTYGTGFDPDWVIVDFGVFDIPQSGTYVGEGERTLIAVLCITPSAQPETYLESLIMIPADEWIAEVDTSADIDIGCNYHSNFVTFDSLTDYREELLTLKGNDSSFQLSTYKVEGSAPGKLLIPPNTNVDLWVLPMGVEIASDSTYNCYRGEVSTPMRARLEVMERYLGLRGNR